MNAESSETTLVRRLPESPGPHVDITAELEILNPFPRGGRETHRASLAKPDLESRSHSKVHVLLGHAPVPTF